MLNKLVLWTVQFWLDYWINNKNWKPELEVIYWILDVLFANWIFYLDTATAYWNSEEIIWWYIKEKWLKWKVKIISKLTWVEDSNDIYDYIQKQIKESINKLWLDNLDWYLLHNVSNFYNKGILNSIIKIKNDWLVSNIWVSIYEIEDAINVSNNKLIDYIQIPFNILDQRLNSTEFFINCKRNWIKIFARSPFLQWLILMDEKKIPLHLSWVIPHLRKFDKIISKYWITRAEACIYYVLQNKNIDFFLFWVDSVDQLKQNINTIQKNIDFSEWIIEIEQEFANIEKNIISPNLW